MTCLKTSQKHIKSICDLCHRLRARRIQTKVCPQVIHCLDCWNLSNRPHVSIGYLQVNALSEWIIGIYLHEFTNNEREISIPHEAADGLVRYWKFRVHCWWTSAMSALTFLLFKLNTLQTKIVKLWVCRSHGVMTVVYWIYTTPITPR